MTAVLGAYNAVGGLCHNEHNCTLGIRGKARATVVSVIFGQTTRFRLLFSTSAECRLARGVYRIWSDYTRYCVGKRMFNAWRRQRGRQAAEMVAAKYLHRRSPQAVQDLVLFGEGPVDSMVEGCR